jgi:single-stranded-DNA-specific exonuclease
VTDPRPSRWLIAPADPPRQQALARQLSVPPPIAQVLLNRGYRDAEAARAFLRPQLRQLRDPFELPGMAAAVERIRAGGRTVIYGDYDVDGITASALLTRVLRAAGLRVSNFLPHRMDEGYGLSADGIARCLREHKPELILAVDCGTSSVSEISKLKSRGVDVIVLDHHEPPAELPQCVLVNPKLHPAHTPLASVGVAFKLAHALLKRDRQLDIDLREHLDLVALGTLADLVPLTGENRILARAGLERMPATTKTGVRALMEVAAVGRPVTPYHVGFRLGPRLNAAGRLGDAMAALELLLTDDEPRARRLAELLDAHNAERQQIEERIVAEAVAMAAERPSDRVLVLANQRWHTGVIGIVASRLVQQFHRPTVIIGADGKGSCRSIAGFSMVGALAACADLLERYGGHEMAAGFSVTAGNVEALRRRLNERAADLDLQRRLHVDAVVRLRELDEEFFRALDALEPCGPDNPTPLFAATGLRLRGEPRVLKERHLKFYLTDGETTAEAIWWGGAGQELPAELDVAFVAEQHVFGDVETARLVVRDVRPATGRRELEFRRRQE